MLSIMTIPVCWKLQMTLGLQGFSRLLRGSKHAIFIAIITGNPLIA
jgi:hypothetical protein